MNNISNILIAVELDKKSEVLIEYGITLSLMMDAHVRCLYISRPIGYSLNLDDEGNLLDEYSDITKELTPEEIQDMEIRELRELDDMVQSVLNKMEIPEYKVKTLLRSAHVVDGILGEARGSDTELIVIGANVGFRKNDMSIFNLSREIVEKTDKAVIVVPSIYGSRNLDHLCMSVNFEFEELIVIKRMIEFSITNQLKFTFIYVIESEERVVEIEKKIKAYKRIFLENVNEEMVSFTMMAGSTNDVIDELTKSMDVDLICVKTKKKHWNFLGLQRTFEYQVMNHIKVPLYIW